MGDGAVRCSAVQRSGPWPQGQSDPLPKGQGQVSWPRGQTSWALKCEQELARGGVRKFTPGEGPWDLSAFAFTLWWRPDTPYQACQAVFV